MKATRRIFHSNYRLAWIIHEDSPVRGNRAKQVGKSGEKRGPPRAEPDLPRCDAILFLMVNRHTANYQAYQI